MILDYAWLVLVDTDIVQPAPDKTVITLRRKDLMGRGPSAKMVMSWSKGGPFRSPSHYYG